MRQPPLPRFRSPLRGPWLTATFARVLLIGLPVVIVTGLLSYAAYEPRLGGKTPHLAPDSFGSTCSNGRPARRGSTA